MTQQFKIKFINKHGRESPGAASSFRLAEGPVLVFEGREGFCSRTSGVVL